MSLTDESDDFKDVAQLNYNKIHSSMSKAGYADGITDGREGAFQRGFDCAYADGLRRGFEVAKYKAFFAVEKISKHADLTDENFKNSNDPVEVLSHIHTQHMEMVKNNFQKDLPLTTNVFLKKTS